MKNLGHVRLDRVEKHYGLVAALKTIDLEIRPNEFFALLGPSGSGKTTTLRLIAGLEAPSAGRILFDGQDVTDTGPGERDIAMVFQSYALYPHMTVAENIAFPLRMSGVPKIEIGKLVRETAERVRIHNLLDRRPGQLSGGSSSAARWRVQSCARRAYSCSMSRFPISMPSSAWKRASSSSRSSVISTLLPSTSRTTRKKP
jgi:multiple sugar transport system ATP-binding protein